MEYPVCGSRHPGQSAAERRIGILVRANVTSSMCRTTAQPTTVDTDRTNEPIHRFTKQRLGEVCHGALCKTGRKRPAVTRLLDACGGAA